MGKKGGAARKQEAAEEKAEDERRKQQETEDARWEAGAKKTGKKEADKSRRDQQLKDKEERRKALEAEEAGMPEKPKNAKVAQKKAAPKLKVSDLDEAQPELAASNIDDGIDLLGIVVGSDKQDQPDRHPERRYEAALKVFLEEELPKMDADGRGRGLRLAQKKERLRKEFEKSPANPYNKLNVDYNARKETVQDVKQKEQSTIEERLAKN